MNANPKFLSATAHVDEAAVKPLPNSRKVYVEGSRPDIRVPMREITQSDTPASFGARRESADLRLRHLRPVHRSGGEDRHPLGTRAAAEQVDRGAQRYRGARRTDLALRARAARRSEARGAALQPEAQAAPRQGGHERDADALRAPRHRSRRRWNTSRSARTSAATRSRSLLRRQHPGQRLRRRDPESDHARSSCATRSRAAAPSFRPTSIIRKPSR